MRDRNPYARGGFTLIEILIALAIVGLLVGVVATRMDGIFGRSQEQVAEIFVNESMKTSLMRYRMDTGDYPTTEEGLAALATAPEARAERWRGPYIDTKGGKLPSDPWGETYLYRYPGTRNTAGYDLFSKGKDRTPDTADDIGNW
jgi:general secretion pathway protein G